MSNEVKKELEQTPWYKFLTELVYMVNGTMKEGEPMELVLDRVMKFPLPENMAVASAAKAKLLFMLAMYTMAGRYGSLTDALPGTVNAILLITGKV